MTAGIITEEFPGHAIFQTHDLFWKPLYHQDELLPGNQQPSCRHDSHGRGQVVRQGHVRSSSIPMSIAPYRMSFDYQGMLKRSYTDIFSRYNKGGEFWKVKLVISPEQLVEILSQEARTEKLIESVRTVAKCENGTSSTVAFSDQWSLSSSRNASSYSKKDDLLLEM